MLGTKNTSEDPTASQTLKDVVRLPDIKATTLMRCPQSLIMEVAKSNFLSFDIFAVVLHGDPQTRTNFLYSNYAIDPNI